MILMTLPWGGRDEIGSVGSTAGLGWVRLVSVCPAGSQYEGIYPHECHAYQNRKPFEYRDVSKRSHVLQILHLKRKK